MDLGRSRDVGHFAKDAVQQTRLASSHGAANGNELAELELDVELRKHGFLLLSIAPGEGGVGELQADIARRHAGLVVSGLV